MRDLEKQWQDHGNRGSEDMRIFGIFSLKTLRRDPPEWFDFVFLNSEFIDLSINREEKPLCEVDISCCSLGFGSELWSYIFDSELFSGFFDDIILVGFPFLDGTCDSRSPEEGVMFLRPMSLGNKDFSGTIRDPESWDTISLIFSTEISIDVFYDNIVLIDDRYEWHRSLLYRKTRKIHPKFDKRERERERERERSGILEESAIIVRKCSPAKFAALNIFLSEVSRMGWKKPWESYLACWDLYRSSWKSTSKQVPHYGYTNWRWSPLRY